MNMTISVGRCLERKAMWVWVKEYINKNFAPCKYLCNLQELYTAFKKNHLNVQINFVLPSVFPLKFICDHFYISIIHKSILFNRNITSSPYLEMLLINMIKLLLCFLSVIEMSMWPLLICGGFNSRRFSYSNILIVLISYS